MRQPGDEFEGVAGTATECRWAIADPRSAQPSPDGRKELRYGRDRPSPPYGLLSNLCVRSSPVPSQQLRHDTKFRI
jgi:hypothetical protein